ncbi:hypothetical protein K439DRAFT_1614289 [Ramaria rubella]|nr:hypothetical protein K439DRAFT_1614289 [Ramaria rubella]
MQTPSMPYPALQLLSVFCLSAASADHTTPQVHNGAASMLAEWRREPAHWKHADYPPIGNWKHEPKAGSVNLSRPLAQMICSLPLSPIALSQLSPLPPTWTRTNAISIHTTSTARHAPQPQRCTRNGIVRTNVTSNPGLCGCNAGDVYAVANCSLTHMHPNTTSHRAAQVSKQNTTLEEKKGAYMLAAWPSICSHNHPRRPHLVVRRHEKCFLLVFQVVRGACGHEGFPPGHTCPFEMRHKNILPAVWKLVVSCVAVILVGSSVHGCWDAPRAANIAIITFMTGLACWRSKILKKDSGFLRDSSQKNHARPWLEFRAVYNI